VCSLKKKGLGRTQSGSRVHKGGSEQKQNKRGAKEKTTFLARDTCSSKSIEKKRAPVPEGGGGRRRRL